MKKLKNYLEILKNCPLFSEIGEEELVRMLTCLGAKTETFDKKYTIFAEGAPARHLGILLSGSAQIVQTDYYGNRSILSGIGEGEVFAEAFACADVSEIPVNVVTTENSEVLLIEAKRILHMCSSACGFHNRLIYNLMKLVATDFENSAEECRAAVAELCKKYPLY